LRISKPLAVVKTVNGFLFIICFLKKGKEYRTDNIDIAIFNE